MLHASLELCLTATLLRFANTSPPSGCVEVFHLQVAEHARHTKKAITKMVMASKLYIDYFDFLFLFLLCFLLRYLLCGFLFRFFLCHSWYLPEKTFLHADSSSESYYCVHFDCSSYIFQQNKQENRKNFYSATPRERATYVNSKTFSRKLPSAIHRIALLTVSRYHLYW